ncbi:MAG: hypothetical protein O7E52_01250 [Candidatus Poribacteria bacterium]|nr:hypothetical protein [Candidatus Poribacteria bacterium]
MYIIEVVSTSKSGKTYRSILLRESYRKGGQVKNRTLVNLSKCKPEEVAAIKLALKHKNNLAVLESVSDCVELFEGPSIGAIFVVYQIAKRLGIDKALGRSFDAKLALWQVIARVIEQGSRLSAVRLAQRHATCDVLDLPRGFDENDLYENLKWLSNNGQGESLRIPTPREQSQQLLDALQVQLPDVLSHAKVPIVTRKKLTQSRKGGNKQA